MSINTWIHGFGGRIGQLLLEMEAQYPEITIIGGSNSKGTARWINGSMEPQKETLADALKDAQLVIDFSTPEGNQTLFDAVRQTNTPLAILLATTGLNTTQIEGWQREVAPTCQVLLAPNTSLGIILSVALSKKLAAALGGLSFDIEIVESHHRHKRDAPSGTALLIADEIAKQEDLKTVYGRPGLRQSNELGLSSLRGGAVFGEHEIKFLGDHEEITISHKALSRRLFADGAFCLGKWLMPKPPGFYHVANIPPDDIKLK